ncbi:MAG TPA: indolepyruvate ferredoxin oxidoreductase family protein [Trebonia sp.]|jgi:indolepyruvate ferredoxin oxidoreductase
MTAAFSPRVATLDERYQRQDGTIYLTGIQALVRMLLDRARYDRERGLATAGYVSGYEGSPLGGYDLELARHRDLLSSCGIVHQPGLNEELAATAVSGTQLAGRVGDAKHDGVTGVWYGKAPGLDRATDALRHANMIGTSPTGGAVALVGDDPSAKSSTLPCSSEMALAGLMLPTFYPADPAEALVHGLHAVELSRASGLWSAMKVVTAMADGASTAQVSPHWQAPDLADLHHSDQHGGLRAYGHQPRARLLGAELAELERSQQLTRLPIALEYIRRSGLNVVTGPRAARIGLVAAGKTYLDVRQALTALGLTEADLERHGIRLLKLGVIYPLEPSVVAEFAAGLDEIVVVEDKRAFLEDAVKSVLYGTPGAPAVYGKRSRDGAPLFTPVGELDSDAVADSLARHFAHLDIPVRQRPRERVMLPLAQRMPYFCSGCPHNSSTKVAPGTLVGGGIGCHAMVAFMPPEQVGEVTGLCQMGGEGAQWMGIAPFVTQRHLVQNLGDGTFAHSGSLAIRAAVASGANITFKLLRNSAVAMTGGQQAVGELPVDRLIALLAAEGVRKTVVTTDDPARLRRQLGARVIKHRADIRHRDDLIDVQRELAAIDGVTVLIHDQECAAEKRRKRRRGKVAAPAQRAFINERVCEGCGDCGRASNCLSVQPVATEFGRKTRIHQSSCNLDFSCLNGDCPSFLTVTPAASGARRPAAPARPEPTAPAEPERLFGPDGFTMRITGVGGTGVVTIAQILGTAFAADGRQVRSLDQTGLAQKGGAVVSDLSISTGPAERSAKLGYGECDLYLGCDSLVATDGTQLRAASKDRTVAVVSTTEVPTGQMVVDVSQHFPATGQVMAAVEAKVRSARFLDAAALATDQFGDEQYANMILVGAAYQAGALPVSAEAIEHAIRLNGVAVDANLRAFRTGRTVDEAAAPAAAVVEDAGVPAPRQLADVLARRVSELTAFQDQACADEYAGFVERVRAREAVVTGGDTLATTVAEYLYKLTAYKDEYEVARLSLDPALDAAVRAQFGDGARYQYRLHPPVFRALGLRHKISLGPWFRPAFATLVAMRRLRGTRLDPFGRTEVRRTERALITEYREVVDQLLADLTAGNHELAVQIAALPDMVRGYEDIKLATVRAYREKLAELRAEFAAAAAPTLVR